MRNLAEKVGCTSGYISQIEKGTLSPSISTLKKLATALEVKLVDFFLEEEIDEGIVIRNGEGFEIKYPQGDASIFLLVKKLSGRLWSPFWPALSQVLEVVGYIPMVADKNLVM